MKIDGKLALVTGGAARLGRAFTETLAGAGMRVAIHYRTRRLEAEALEADLRGRAGDPACAASFHADFDDPASAAGLLDRVEARMGPVDALVLSASSYPQDTIEESDLDAVEASLRVNLVSPFLLAREAGLRMRTRGGGHILALLDWCIDRPYPDRLPYTMAKAGLRTAVFGLARALAPEVCVNGIAPGAVLLPEGTDADLRARIVRATPLGRIGNPTDVAEAALYLLRSEFVTGTVLTVDGGRSVR